MPLQLSTFAADVRKICKIVNPHFLILCINCEWFKHVSAKIENEQYHTPISVTFQEFDLRFRSGNLFGNWYN